MSEEILITGTPQERGELLKKYGISTTRYLKIGNGYEIEITESETSLVTEPPGSGRNIRDKIEVYGIVTDPFGANCGLSTLRFYIDPKLIHIGLKFTFDVIPYSPPNRNGEGNIIPINTHCRNFRN